MSFVALPFRLAYSPARSGPGSHGSVRQLAPCCVGIPGNVLAAFCALTSVNVPDIFHRLNSREVIQDMGRLEKTTDVFGTVMLSSGPPHFARSRRSLATGSSHGNVDEALELQQVCIFTSRHRLGPARITHVIENSSVGRSPCSSSRILATSPLWTVILGRRGTRTPKLWYGPWHRT